MFWRELGGASSIWQSLAQRTRSTCAIGCWTRRGRSGKWPSGAQGLGPLVCSPYVVSSAPNHAHSLLSRCFGGLPLASRRSRSFDPSQVQTVVFLELYNMLHRAVALLLVLILALGWAGASVNAAAGVPCTSDPGAAASASAECRNCSDSDERKQSRCTHLACTSACAATNMTWLAIGSRSYQPTSETRTQAPPPAVAALIRALRPDLPPPR